MIWLKVVAGILAAVGVIAGVFAWKASIEKNALLELDLAIAEEQVIEERAAREDSDRARVEYHDELAVLKTARDSQPARVVRVCTSVPAAAGDGVRDPAGSARTLGETAAAGGVPPAPGPDIGPELYAAADDADLDVAACRALYGLAKAFKRRHEPAP